MFFRARPLRFYSDSLYCAWRWVWDRGALIALPLLLPHCKGRDRRSPMTVLGGLTTTSPSRRTTHHRHSQGRDAGLRIQFQTHLLEAFDCWVISNYLKLFGATHFLTPQITYFEFCEPCVHFQNFEPKAFAQESPYRPIFSYYLYHLRDSGSTGKIVTRYQRRWEITEAEAAALFPRVDLGRDEPGPVVAQGGKGCRGTSWQSSRS
ncbi:unnamed protein product [Sphagnum tenellum]